MLNTYIDESYGKEDYYTAALTINDVAKAKLEKDLLEIKQQLVTRYHLPADIEFHAHQIMQGKGAWDFLREDVKTALKIYKQILAVMADVKPFVVIEGVDIARLKRRYSYPHPPYDITLRHALERVNEFATEQGEVVRVIADNRSDYVQYQNNIITYSILGTPGYRSSLFDKIRQPIEYQDSCSNILLQAVDLLTYIARRYEENLGSPKARKATRNLFNIIKDFSTVRKWLP